MGKPLPLALEQRQRRLGDMVLRRPSLNLPNRLTLLRLGLCGLFLLTMSFPWPYAVTTALLIFSLASLTDWLDGALARRYNLITDLGKLLDPLADKVLVLGALISLVGRPIAPAPMWMVVVIMAREFLISGLRQLAAKKQQILAAERVGKHKTISQIVVILVSLSYLSLGEFKLQETVFARFLLTAEMPLYWIALIITVLSGMIYFFKNSGLFQESLAAEPSTAEAPVPSAPAPASFPAFKEWTGIVEALGQGAQIIILRKGGIAEGRAGFQADRYPQFWLFPTQYHQQWEKTRPELQQKVARPLTSASQTDLAAEEIVLHYVAEVTDEIYLETWEQVERLAEAHYWQEELLRERFDYQDRPGMKPGLYLLLVRVAQVRLPHRLKPDTAYQGCKSWIQVPVGWDTLRPVVPAEEFATRRSRILAAVKIPAAVHG